jgi:predicted porin
MKKNITILISLFLLISFVTEAQYYYGRPRVRVRVHPQPPYPRSNQNYQKRPSFQPTLNFSIGYGFPNLDKDQLANFIDAYKGTASQKGPITGAVDYQFSRNMSIGLMGTYGKVTLPYYDYNSNNPLPAFTGSLENWSVMFNLMNYMPTYNRQLEPYLRIAIGINNWTQSYLDPQGNKAAELPEPSQLAYQVSLGTRINLSKGAGFFVEAGYGKYILNGGLTLKF